MLDPGQPLEYKTGLLIFLLNSIIIEVQMPGGLPLNTLIKFVYDIIVDPDFLLNRPFYSCLLSYLAFE